MATVNKNLSNYDFSFVPSARGMKFGVVVAEWNDITEGLFKGAKDALLNCGCEDINIIRKNVPGSFELPCSSIFRINRCRCRHLFRKCYSRAKHFDYVCQSTALGIKDVSLKYNKPVIFGVLTDNTLQQAIDRSGGKYGNKGIEAAISAIKMVHLKSKLNCLHILNHKKRSDLSDLFAEREGFEPRTLLYNGFQDHRIRPLAISPAEGKSKIFLVLFYIS